MQSLVDVRLVKSRIYDKNQHPPGNPLIQRSTFPRSYIRECSTSFGGASAGSWTRSKSQFRDAEPALAVHPVPPCKAAHEPLAESIRTRMLLRLRVQFYLRLMEGT
jgi:hypothetical protein